MDTNTTIPMPPIKQLVERLGGPSLIAREINRTHGAVCQWNQIPAEYVPALVALSRKRGDTLTARDLRPDIDWSLLDEAH